MTNNRKKQDIRDLENLIRETDEKHQKAMEEMRESNAKALEELKLLIVGRAIPNSEAGFPSHEQASNPANNGVLGPRMGYNGFGHYTKLDFLRFDG